MVVPFRDVAMDLRGQIQGRIDQMLVSSHMKETEMDAMDVGLFSIRDIFHYHKASLNPQVYEVSTIVAQGAIARGLDRRRERGSCCCLDRSYRKSGLFPLRACRCSCLLPWFGWSKVSSFGALFVGISCDVGLQGFLFDQVMMPRFFMILYIWLCPYCEVATDL